MGKALKYTDYEKQWIKENRCNYNTIKELLNDFNVKFNKNMPISYMKELVITLGTKVGRKKFFDNPHGIWLRKYRKIYENLEELRLEFNKKFNVNISYYYIKKMVQNFNAFPENKKSNNTYTLEELEWFRQNYQKFMLEFRFDYEGLRKEFENRFNKKLSKFYHDHLFREKLKINVTYDRSKTTHAKNIVMYPIGYEKKDRNIWLVKTHNTNLNKGKRIAHREGYRPKAHILYEQYHNVKINDKTHIVTHLDNNYNNFNKDNLFLIEKNAFHSMSPNWYLVNNPRLKKCMLLQTQAKYLIKQNRKEDK